MTSRMSDQTDLDAQAFAEMVLHCQQERLDLMRQVDLLQLQVHRYRNEAEAAVAQAAMLQAALDRHMARCGSNEAAIQRLRADLQDANRRRKEQAALIERRDARIAALIEAMPIDLGGGANLISASPEAEAAKGDPL